MTSTTSLFDPKTFLETYWDSKDVDKFVNCFTDDQATWKVNTLPEVTGREGIEELTQSLMATTKSSRHHDLRVIIQQNENSATTTTPGYEHKPKTYVVHGNVEYELLDTTKPNVICRFCDIMEVDCNEKVRKCWTYMDTTPLTTAAAAASTATTEEESDSTAKTESA